MPENALDCNAPMKIETNVTRLLGIDFPIIQAGMSWVSSCAALPIAVSNAGGLGVVAVGPLYRDDLAAIIDAIRAATDKPFAVNLPLNRKGVEEIMDLLVEKRIAIVIASQGGPKKYLDRFKAIGTTCIHVVASEEHAKKAIDAGVDGLVVAGAEAGGHPPPDLVSTLVVGRSVIQAAPDFPIILSGGFADGYGLAAALALGAGAAQFGTRFMLTPEARIHPAYQQRLRDARVSDTLVVGRGFGVVRVLKNKFSEGMREAEWAGLPEDQRRPMFQASTLKLAASDGDVEAGKMEAGQTAGLIFDVTPAADVVNRIVQDYAAAVGKLPPLRA